LVLAGSLVLVACFVAYFGQQTEHRVAEVEQLAMPEPEARVVDLPDDGGAWHLSLAIHGKWRHRAADRRLISWFHGGHAGLTALKAQCFGHVYYDHQTEFKTKLAPLVGDNVPAVVLQDQHGKVVYRAAATGPATTKMASALGIAEPLRPLPSGPNEMAECIFERLRERRNPRPQPPPCPQPTPDDTNVVDTGTPPQPVNGPPVVAEPEPSNPWWLLVVVVIAAAGIAVFIQFKNRVNPE
jgi:hypothetical protein